MLQIFTTIDNELTPLNKLEKGCWINMINPTEDEIKQISEEAGLYTDFLSYPLDDDELPRLEAEDDQMMIIINVPVFGYGKVLYETVPLGIILNDDLIVTVCLEDVNLVNEFRAFRSEKVITSEKTRFILQLLQHKTNLYLKYLRAINRRHDAIEQELHKSMKNKELISLLDLSKSLVYFNTSLRSNNRVLERLLRSKPLKMDEDDEDLLEDILIENKQAVEMVEIYSNISTGLMDAVAGIISNNLSIVMKFLAGITIVLSIPTIIGSYWGMNVPVPLGNHPWGFAILIVFSLLLCVLSLYALYKRDML